MTSRHITSNNNSEKPASESNTAAGTASTSANALYAAMVAAYRKMVDVQERSPGELSEQYETLPGHISSHVLDFAGGNRSGLTFIAAKDDNPNSDNPDLVLIALYCDEGITVYLQEPDTFTVSTERSEDAEYDCGLMLTADPARMDEMDAFGAFFQLADKYHCEFIPW